jgi:transcriptional regulator with XRE-family HTH domain
MTSTFAERLRYIRNQNNLTMEEAASKLDLSTSGYGKYERNERQPSFEVLVRISKVFNISSDFLLGVNATKNEESVEDWLLEINYSSEMKKEAMKNIWEQVKNL